jgi:hypothetical protein
MDRYWIWTPTPRCKAISIVACKAIKLMRRLPERAVYFRTPLPTSMPWISALFLMMRERVGAWK